MKNNLRLAKDLVHSRRVPLITYFGLVSFSRNWTNFISIEIRIERIHKTKPMKKTKNKTHTHTKPNTSILRCKKFCAYLYEYFPLLFLAYTTRWAIQTDIIPLATYNFASITTFRTNRMDNFIALFSPFRKTILKTIESFTRHTEPSIRHE